MSNQDLPESFLELLKQVRGKRARIVVDHILEHGSITTEDLETRYGYRHPPRAVRDVREQGIPIETFNVKNADGMTIAAYRFGNPDDVEHGKLGGRKTFSKQFKSQLFEQQNGHCAICNTVYESRYLQVDHRVPYEVAGETDAADLEAHMLLCASCNRAKSWSCEHCENGTSTGDKEICGHCYWASPLDYEHIAMRLMRRLDITFLDDEIDIYDRLQQLAGQSNSELRGYIKNILKNRTDETTD